MRYLLSCAHTAECRDWDMFNTVMVCPVCAQRRRLLAIESREWHVSCDDCRFGRWCGQSEELARHYSTRHISGHRVHSDYLSYPATKERIRSVFGRRVKTYIDLPSAKLDHPKLVLPVQGVIPDVSDDNIPF